jgi:hypothetical protein
MFILKSHRPRGGDHGNSPEFLENNPEEARVEENVAAGL